MFFLSFFIILIVQFTPFLISFRISVCAVFLGVVILIASVSFLLPRVHISCDNDWIPLVEIDHLMYDTQSSE